MIAPDDPRICKTPFAEFDHLSLKDVVEFERLRRVGEWRRFTPRYLHLLRRRAPNWRTAPHFAPEAA